MRSVQSLPLNRPQMATAVKLEVVASFITDFRFHSDGSCDMEHDLQISGFIIDLQKQET